MQERIVS